MELTLRPYQEECVNLINSLDSGSYLVQAAVGLGKTVIFTHINRRGRMLILSHREELVHQPLKYFDCECGVECAKEHSNGEEVVSASVQSLIRRLHKFSPDDFDIIITDEAHHAAAPSYRKIYNYFKCRLHIGFTATPNRGDHVRLTDVFDDIIFKKDLRWGIENHWLANIECLRVNIGFDIRKVKKTKGDFDISALADAVNQKAYTEGIAKAYRELSKGQTLIFAVNIEHANAIAKEIEGSVVVTASTENREEIIERFKNKDIRCLINCMVFTEGTDLPLIETIIIARPTPNASLYQQMVGRGTRLFPGKENLRLIDCVGVSDNLKICTAPTLLGLDPSKVPKEKEDKIEGLLTEMEETIKAIIETSPESWIINSRKVDLFAKEHGYNLHGVRYDISCDGSYVCHLKDGVLLSVGAPDELEKTKVKYISKKTGESYESKREVSFQQALDISFNLLMEMHSEEKALWNKDIVEEWGKNPASVKQIDFIKKLMSDKKNSKRFDFDGFEPENLNKYEASIVINRLLE